ncbi:uncharacterized protein [Rhodnius prolixus]|uniref:Uncharacterized protein n=1 Tax=Rhodnius prolixus TaxID=13249 RepID=T1I7H8_RHOPR
MKVLYVLVISATMICIHASGGDEGEEESSSPPESSESSEPSETATINATQDALSSNSVSNPSVQTTLQYGGKSDGQNSDQENNASNPTQQSSEATNILSSETGGSE